jgi:hypothetical protein
MNILDHRALQRVRSVDLLSSRGGQVGKRKPKLATLLSLRTIVARDSGNEDRAGDSA